MRLRLHRSATRSLFGSVEYHLTVELFTSRQEADVIAAHRLTEHTVYIVPEALEYQRRTNAALERDRSLSAWRDGGAVVRSNLTAFYFWLRTRLAFSVTVASMMQGTIINCTNLEQLLACERELIAAFDTLKLSVDDALAFDQGREQLLAPDAEDDTERAPPATWRPNQRLIR